MEQSGFLPAENWEEGAVPIGGGWMICKSRFVCQGKLYYYNVFTGHSLWSLPPAVFAAQPPFPPPPPIALPPPQGRPVPKSDGTHTNKKKAKPQQKPYGRLPKKKKKSTGEPAGAPPEAIQSSSPDEERPLVIDQDMESQQPDNDGKAQDTREEDGAAAGQDQAISNENTVGAMQLFRDLRMQTNKDASMLRPASVSFMDIVKPDSQESLVGERGRWIFFVLDTSVLLHRPDIIYDLQAFNRLAQTTKIDRRVRCVIPWATLQELETLKKAGEEWRPEQSAELRRLARRTMELISSSRASDLKELLWIQPMRDEFAVVGLQVAAFEDRIIRCILLIRDKASLRENVVVACTEQESLAKKARGFNVKVMAPGEVKGILK